MVFWPMCMQIRITRLISIAKFKCWSRDSSLKLYSKIAVWIPSPLNFYLADWRSNEIPVCMDGRPENIKTHIRDKWVCSAETNISSPIPDFISVRYIAECRLSGSNGQAQNLIFFFFFFFILSPQTCIWAQAVFAYPFNPLYSHSARSTMKSVP